MSGDRRQVDRRQADRQNSNERKELTMSVTAFVIFVAVIAIVFVLAASFLAVYYEKRISEIIQQNSEILQLYDDAATLIYTTDEEIEYFDVENIVSDPNVSTNLITDANAFEEEIVDENDASVADEETVDADSVDENTTTE